jgi:hypothetical protein
MIRIEDNVARLHYELAAGRHGIARVYGHVDDGRFETAPDRHE